MLNRISFLLILAFSVNVFGQGNDRIFVEEGDKIFNFGDYEDAILFYQLAIEENPKNVRAHYMAGACFLITTAEKQEAVHYLKKAYDLDSEVSNDILFKIGEGHRFRYEFKDAIDFYNEYINEIEVNRRAYEGEDIEALIKRAKKRISECLNAERLMSEPVPFKAKNVGGIVNSIDFDYAPTINLDETTMYFTSRREGTTGGFKDVDNKYFEDIWVTEKVNGEWSAPRNLGAPINTNQHESNIGLSPDGNTLYIYHTENNGDIYFSDKKNGKWSEIEPMDKNVNTEYQETSISISENNSYLFFTSARPGGSGQLDIYLMRRTKKGKWSKPENIGDVVNTEYNEDYPFFDSESSTLYFSSKGHNSMGGLDVFSSEWDTINNVWSEPVNLGYPINTVDDDGFYTISGHTGHAYYASFKDDSHGYLDLYQIVPADEEEEVIEEEVVEEIVVDTLAEDSSAIVEVEPEVEELPIVEVPKVVMSKTALTVNVFDSETREPISNFNVEVHELVNQNSKATNLSQNEFELSDTVSKEFVVVVNSEGYIFQSKNYQFVPGKENDEVSVYLAAQEVFVPKVLRNIYFKFDKYTLDDKYTGDLDQLAQMMNSNPSMTIEIAGHTDFKGSEQYNISLSQKRADAVRSYLESKGVDGERIVTKGYGEKYPLATNDDELEGRELNRRTEFIILSEQ